MNLSVFFFRTFSSLIAGFMMFVAFMGASVMSYQANYDGRIFPGVSVGGMDLSGQTPEEALATLNRSVHYPDTGQIAFKDNTTVWTATPAQLGLTFDGPNTVNAAYIVGREGNLTQRISTQIALGLRGRELAPLFVYDERVAQGYLVTLAETINRATIEASLGLNGVDVVVNSGQVGRSLDIGTSLARISPQLQTLTDGLIPLVVDESEPVILDATEQAEIAQRILSGPLTLSLPNGDTSAGPWVFDQQTLARMLAIERVSDGNEGEKFQIGLNSDELRVFLNSAAPALAVSPKNARFTFEAESGELSVFEDSVIGRTLLVEPTIEQINARIAEGEHEIDLVFDYELPAATSDTRARELGITELVSTNTSYFYGSSTGRIQNIATAAAQFHGVLVAPGETFSMANIIGDISLDNGYAEALIIFGDRTIKGVGGGVCQVSTTLFRAAFFGGFQIDQRYSHAYRVYYYELSASGSQNNNLAGLDATVYVPLVDFKFTNDSDNWLLMETIVNAPARSITWNFYSTGDGRTVEWTTTGLTNRVKPPEPLYIENPDLAKNEINQVDWAVDGADVSVTRTVLRGSETVHADVFKTHYQPWRAVYEYGPGSKNIPGQKDDD